jgi:hypothetical protein
VGCCDADYKRRRQKKRLLSEEKQAGGKTGCGERAGTGEVAEKLTSGAKRAVI